MKFFEVLLHYFRKGKNAVQAWKKLYDVYGKKSLIERQWQNWFPRFHSGDFELKDAPRSGRPTVVGDDKIKAMIDNNRRSRTQEIVDKLNPSVGIDAMVRQIIPCPVWQSGHARVML